MKALNVELQKQQKQFTKTVFTLSKRKNDKKRGKAEDNVGGGGHIPHIITKPQPLPTLTNLINMRERYHLSSSEESQNNKNDRSILASAEADAQALEKDEQVPVLDLGTMALQRIVTQMKGMGYKSNSCVN